jgi:hypothetical protein
VASFACFFFLLLYQFDSVRFPVLKFLNNSGVFMVLFIALQYFMILSSVACHFQGCREKGKEGVGNLPAKLV